VSASAAEPATLPSRERLRCTVSRLKSVPTLPKLLERVVGALEDPEVNFKGVAELIEIDQALTAQILRLANSAFYQVRGVVGSVSQALVTLGATVTRSVVLSTTVFDMRTVGLRGFWEHSLGCAVAAGAIAKETGIASPEEVAAAGLLHDLGKVVLYKELPDVFIALVEEARARGASFREVERERLGADHCEIASWLVERWRFPPVLAEPIVFHHTPGAASVACAETAIVHVADTLVQALGHGSGGTARLGAIDPSAWVRLGLTPPRLDRVLDRFDADLDRALNYALYE